MMKFYRENKVNPLASCLPLVAQLPVFLALFYMLRKDLRHDICPEVNPPGTPNPEPCGAGGDAEFLFIPDLTDKATGGVLVALIVLYVGSQLLSSCMSTATRTGSSGCIMFALPFFFVTFVINSRPACSSTGSRRTCGRSCSRRSCGSGSGRCDHPADAPAPGLGGCFERPVAADAATGSRRDGARPAGAVARASARRARPRAARRRRRLPRRARRRSARGGADERRGRPGRARPRPARARSPTRWGSSGASRSSSTRRDPRHADGEDLGLFIGRHGQTIDAVQHLAYKAAAHGADAAPRVESSTPRATASGGARCCTGRPTRRRTTPCARPPGGAGRDERDGAQGRARAPEGPRRRRDLLRGHGARPPPRRRAAALTTRETFHVGTRRSS